MVASDAYDFAGVGFNREVCMTNIPTDLLRTFVAVVDMRSFTKAAISLGVTQPAVSSQIKRLQFLLGEDIFDRSTSGVSLTPHGEVVIS
jgi:DNA-binding transcriptional LysR family regulator